MSLYDTIYGTSTVPDNINYTTGSPAVTYPDASFTNVLGTVFLPRIYGKDLSYLEIGSSGKIAVTLTDIHSFDISNTASVVSFTAENTEAFKFVPNDAQKTVAIADMATYSSGNYQQMQTSNSLGFNFVNDVQFSGAVNISGAMDLSGSLNLSGNLTVDSNVLIGGDTQFVGPATFSNNVLVNGKEQVLGTMQVTGVTSLSNDLLVSGKEILQGTLEVVSGTTLDSTLNVTGAASLSNTLNVTGATALDNTLNVVGAASLSNTLNVTGATTLTSTLDVTAASTLHNTLQVVGVTSLSNDLLVAGKEIVQGTLEVVSPTTLDSTLQVVGVASLSNDLLVAGKEIVQGTLEVVSATTLDSTLQVVGVASLSNDLLVAGKEILQGTLEVVSGAKLDSTLNVVGATALSNNLTILGNELLQGTLTVNGASAFTNTVTISNLIVTDQVSFTGSVPSVFENLVVNGLSTFNGHIDVNNSVGISNSLLVQGATRLNNELQVTGLAAFSNDVLINGTLQVVGKVALSNTLNVDAKATFNDAVVIGVNDAGVNVSSVYVGIGTATPTVTLDMGARADGIILPTGNSAARPTGVTGTIRYNSELQTYEGYGNGAWNGLGGVIDVDKNTYISAEDTPNANNNQLKFVTNGSQRMIIQADGTVGIGTDVNPSPSDYELYVKGKSHFNGFVNMNQNLTVENLINAQYLGIGVDAGVSNNLTVGGQVFADEYVAAGLMQFTAPTIKLNGNVEITGSLDTIATETITVEDLWITLASSGNSNAPTREGGLDDKSGILVEGLPSNLTVTASNAKFYEKSIRWNLGEGLGTKSLGQTSSFRDDPFWEVKGGALQISRYTSSNYGVDYTNSTSLDVPQIGYMFRINSNEQLEIVKNTVTSAGVRSGNIVATFGVIMPRLIV
jgi:hypothetical protein